MANNDYKNTSTPVLYEDNDIVSEVMDSTPETPLEELINIYMDSKRFYNIGEPVEYPGQLLKAENRSRKFSQIKHTPVGSMPNVADLAAQTKAVYMESHEDSIRTIPLEMAIAIPSIEEEDFIDNAKRAEREMRYTASVESLLLSSCNSILMSDGNLANTTSNNQALVTLSKPDADGNKLKVVSSTNASRFFTDALFSEYNSKITLSKKASREWTGEQWVAYFENLSNMAAEEGVYINEIMIPTNLYVKFTSMKVSTGSRELTNEITVVSEIYRLFPDVLEIRRIKDKSFKNKMFFIDSERSSLYASQTASYVEYSEQDKDLSVDVKTGNVNRKIPQASGYGLMVLGSVMTDGAKEAFVSVPVAETNALANNPDQQVV